MILIFPQNLVQCIYKSITVHGLFFLRLMPKHGPQFYAEIPAKVASGEIQHREHVYDGLAKAGEGILAQQTGFNSGKAIVHVGDEWRSLVPGFLCNILLLRLVVWCIILQ